MGSEKQLGLHVLKPLKGVDGMLMLEKADLLLWPRTREPVLVSSQANLLRCLLGSAGPHGQGEPQELHLLTVES